MSAILKKITAEAKRIRRIHPKLKWIDAVRQASKKLKGKTVKKKTARKKSAVRKSARPAARVKVTRVKVARVKAARPTKTAAHYMSQARKVLIEDLGKAEARKFIATTKTAKRKIQKTINEKKSRLRKVC